MIEFLKFLYSYLADQSIRTKLIVIFSTLILLISIFIFWYFPLKFEEQALKAVTEKTETIAIMAANNISPAMLYYNDTINIKESIHNLKSTNPDIEFIVVCDSLKSVLQSINLKFAVNMNYQIPDGSFRISNDGYILLYCCPIKFEKKKLGSLFVGVSLSSMHKEADSGRLNITLISLFLLIFGIIIVYLFAKLITNPLNKVVKVFHLISEGDLSQRAIINTTDEIGKLSESFNLMVHKLEIMHKTLENEIEIRKEKEIQLENTKIRLSESLENEQKLNELKTNFISMVSHEYRTPLTVIKTSSYLLDVFFKSNNYDDFKRYSSMIITSADHMAALMDDTLEIGKLISGRNKIEYEMINIIEIIKDVVMLTEISDNNNHRIIVTENIRDYQIYSDKKMINHIFINLLSNACKYSPSDSEIFVNLNVYDKKIQIDVKDKGIGIPESDLKYIFEPFFRASNVGFTPGTGLGMAIIKNSLDAIRAKIKVMSKPDEGTTFSVIIPENI